MNRTLRIAAPVAFAVVVAGALLGVFLSGDSDPDPSESAPATVASSEQDAATPSAGEDGDKAAEPEPADASEPREAAVENTGPAPSTDQPTVDQTREPEGAATDLAATDSTAPSTVAEELAEAGENAIEEVVEAIDGDGGLVERPPAEGVEVGESESVAAVAEPDQTAEVASALDQDLLDPTREDTITPPSFDVVRINPRGDAVIAGRAQPGAEVTIKDGDVDIGTVTADERGEWVLLPDAPLGGGDRELSIIETLPDGEEIESEAVVVLSVPAREDESTEDESALAVLVPRDGEGASQVLQLPPRTAAAESFGVDRADHTADDTVIATGRAAPGGTVQLFVDGASVGTTQADSGGRWSFTMTLQLGPGEHVLRAEAIDEAGQSVAVVEMPLRTGEAASVNVVSVPDEGIRDSDDGSLAIESVDYDEEGDVIIAGKADPGAAVNVYVDDEHVGTIETSDEGAWEIDPGDELEPGEHQLRVDEVDPAGVVLARIETPLVRAEPQELAFGDAVVVVQPGNSLWRIARRTLGGGVHFTVIYEANRNQIRDPKLIYPGQIFTVPRLN
jgi:nucleoid-associated protein YgaU